MARIPVPGLDRETESRRDVAPLHELNGVGSGGAVVAYEEAEGESRIEREIDDVHAVRLLDTIDGEGSQVGVRRSPVVHVEAAVALARDQDVAGAVRPIVEADPHDIRRQP